MINSLGYPWSDCPPGQEWSWGGGDAGAQPGCQTVDVNTTLAQLASKLFDGSSFAGDTRAQKLQYGYFAAKAILDKYDAPEMSYEEGETAMQSIGETINANLSAIISQMQSYASISEMPVQSLSLESRYEFAIRLAKFLFRYTSDLVTFYVNEADRALQSYKPTEFTNEFFNTDVTYRLYIYQAIIEMDRRGAFGPPKSGFQGPEAAPLVSPQAWGVAIVAAILVLAWLGWTWVRSSQEIVKSVAQACIETKDPILCKTAEQMSEKAGPNASLNHAVNVVVGGALLYALIVYGIPTLVEKIPTLKKKLRKRKPHGHRNDPRPRILRPAPQCLQRHAAHRGRHRRHRPRPSAHGPPCGAHRRRPLHLRHPRQGSRARLRRRLAGHRAVRARLHVARAWEPEQVTSMALRLVQPGSGAKRPLVIVYHAGTWSDPLITSAAGPDACVVNDTEAPSKGLYASLDAGGIDSLPIAVAAAQELVGEVFQPSPLVVAGFSEGCEGVRSQLLAGHAMELEDDSIDLEFAEPEPDGPQSDDQETS